MLRTRCISRAECCLSLASRTCGPSPARLPKADALYVFTPNGRQGNYYLDTTQTSQRKQALANLFLPSFHWLGTHQFKTGLDMDRLDYSQDTRRTGFENVGLTNNVLRRVTFAGNGVLSRPSLEASSYIVDNWKIKPNLVLELGPATGLG